jgi:transposase
MNHYAGIDVSLEDSCICVVDANGKVVREGKVSSEPTALIAWLTEVGVTLTRIGLEAGPLSQWLYAAMRQAGLAVELLETRHVRNAFKIMPIKTDRKDARGIAELMRLGWFRPVHCKSMEAQEARAMLTARKLVQKELLETESSLRGILRGFGLKVGNDPNAISVRRNRLQRPDFKARGRLGTCGALRGRSPHPDQAAQRLHELGDADRQAGRNEESRGGAGPQTRCHHASDARRWHAVHDPTSVAPCSAPSRTSRLAAVA